MDARELYKETHDKNWFRPLCFPIRVRLDQKGCAEKSEAYNAIRKEHPCTGKRSPKYCTRRAQPVLPRTAAWLVSQDRKKNTSTVGSQIAKRVTFVLECIFEGADGTRIMGGSLPYSEALHNSVVVFLKVVCDVDSLAVHHSLYVCILRREIGER